MNDRNIRLTVGDAENVAIFSCPGARFSKVPETFRARKAKAKSRTLRLQSCFIHIFLV